MYPAVFKDVFQGCVIYGIFIVVVVFVILVNIPMPTEELVKQIHCRNAASFVLTGQLPIKLNSQLHGLFHASQQLYFTVESHGADSELELVF